MVATAFDPLVIPAHVWQRPDVRGILHARDLGRLFELLGRYGASQSRLATAFGLSQGRISEIVRGRRTVTTLEVFERVADGLDMPDDARMLLGLAPRQPVGLERLGPAGYAEVAAVYTAQVNAAEDIIAAVREADTVDVLAVRGLGLLGLNDALLRPAVVAAAPTRVRVLLLDPDTDAAERRAREIGETPATFRASSHLALARVRELADKLPNTQCLLYRDLPTWRIIAADSALFVSVFGERAEGHLSPMYRITATDKGGALYQGFRRHLDEVARTARRVV